MIQPQQNSGIRTIDTTVSQDISKPNVSPYKNKPISEQTAVEWLVSYMTQNFHLTDEALLKFKEANEIFEKQIMNAFESARKIQCSNEYSRTWDYNDAEQYYKQKFKK
jgi:hypothetical protein